MASVAILTDSTADLTPEQAASAGITVVPLYVRFGSDEYRAGVDLTTEQFWQKLLAAGAAFPTTAAPSPGDFTNAFNAAFDAGAGAIVCPTIGQKLSATFQSATLAAQAMPDREIHVIDTGSTSMSTGIPALIAAEMARAGASAKEIADEVTRRLPDVDLFVSADGLEYLRKGGRLSAARAVVGTMLSVKPIITVTDGLVVMADKERSRAKARATVVASIAKAPDRAPLDPAHAHEHARGGRGLPRAAPRGHPRWRGRGQDHRGDHRRVHGPAPGPGPDGRLVPPRPPVGASLARKALRSGCPLRPCSPCIRVISF